MSGISKENKKIATGLLEKILSDNPNLVKGSALEKMEIEQFKKELGNV